jgi:hypothetical protein
MEFMRLHSLRSWFKLPENDKKQHQIEDCDKCQSIISNAILHTRSASEGTTELYEVCTSFLERDLHFGVFFHECMVKSMPGLSSDKLTVSRNVQL